MAVRLNKALKELNVGINTVAEFLQKKGQALEDATPNAKITDEQYPMLMSAFGDDKNKHDETQQRILERKEREKQEKKELKEKNREEKLRKEQEIFRLKAEKQKPQLKVVGNINDNKPAEKKAEPVATATEVKEVVKEPVAKETPAAADPKKDVAPVATAAPEENKKAKNSLSDRLEVDEDGVYRLSAPQEPSVQFKQVGFIDLSSLNSKTRPDRKSKAEKKKERNEKNGENGEKKKRNRMNNQRVDVEAAAKEQSQQNQGKKKNKNKDNSNQQNGQGKNKNNQGNNGNNNQNGQGGGKKNKKNKQPQKPVELTDEEVAKQVKETLARLTSKQEKKAVKYRKDKRNAARERMNEEEELENAESKVLKLTEFVTVSDLATMMDVPVTKVIGTCMAIGMMVSINQRLDAETINIVAEEFGFTTNYVSEEVSNAIEEEEDREEDLESRAPIITVMGHVDHGKTSLLDYIRKTNVIAGEAGGITQHIGAYNVKMSDGRHITFLDTPGHEAFTAMRARGAQVTDIAIIIVAADDAIMPQTKEAIAHAQAANVPMVFAINKIDKPGANPDKIRDQLAAMNLLVEDWGGKYQCQEISAQQGIGVAELMEKVLLEAEMLDLKANPNRKATGSIIES
ncbi:MAG: translation initiation factor IF-2 N-terminal domain-containing protein, partial [Bacteroidaceae bacterium]|nr:translation initiation factor IF-2 N-terminal domain-containing protein [Bacteroidaceae bacterium]